MCLSIWARAPAPIAIIQTTAATPMITPKMVSPLRSLFARRAQSAITRVSVIGINCSQLTAGSLSTFILKHAAVTENDQTAGSRRHLCGMRYDDYSVPIAIDFVEHRKNFIL